MSELDIFASDPEPFVALTKTHTKAVNDCCFSPLTNQILTAGEDGKVVLWNIPPTNAELHDETLNDENKLVCYNLEEHKSPATSVAMRKDLFVSVCKGGQALLWRLQPNAQREPILGPVGYTCHTRPTLSCSLSLDVRSFATSDERSIKVWSTESKNKSLATWVDGHTGWIKCIQYSKTNELLLASCGDDGRLCIWDVRSGVRSQPCVTISPPKRVQLNCLDWHPVFPFHLVTGAHDSTCTIWDLRNKKRVQVYAEHEDQVNTVAFNSGGSLLLTGSADESSRIFDCLEGRNIFNLLAHKSSITSTCFNPSGELFATASTDKTVTIWKRNFDIVTIVPNDKPSSHSQSIDSITPDLAGDYSRSPRPSQPYHHRHNMYQR